MIKAYCPVCFHDESYFNEDTDYAMCKKCETVFNYDEAIMKTFKDGQPTTVPYRYHSINSGKFEAMTQSEHDLWDEVREDRI